MRVICFALYLYPSLTMHAGPSRVGLQTLPRCQVAVHRLASTSAATARPLRKARQPATPGVDLVAPPDPHSNLRPVIYASSPTRPKSATSPYSVEEFPSGTSARVTSSKDVDDGLSRRARDELELSWRLRRERIDATNHRFWSITNTLFDTHLAHRLSLLPPAADPPTPEDIARRDACLDHFYADWQIANRDRQKDWVLEWWRELWGSLKLELRTKLGGRGPR